MSTGAFSWCLSYHWSQVKSMMLSDWNHTFFINCSASMFSANMQLKPSPVKEVTNHKQNPSQTLAQPLHGIAKPRKKGAFIDYRELKIEWIRDEKPGLPRVSPREVGGVCKWLVHNTMQTCLSSFKLFFLHVFFDLFYDVVPFYDHLLLHIRIKWTKNVLVYMLKRSSNSAQRRAPPSGIKFRGETPGTDSHKCVSCLLFRDVSWPDASMADLVWMTKGNKIIYVCVRKVGLGKNAKQKSVRNGTTNLSQSQFPAYFKF